MEKSDSLSENVKKKPIKSTKNRNVTASEANPIIPDKTKDISEEVTKQVISNILKNGVEKYAKMADNQLKEPREDFETLQAIVSEFLEDFIIIGHTLEGQRVVIRYTASPAELDALTELSKKVLARMIIQEQLGE